MADENYEVQEVQEAEQTDSSRRREVPPLLRQAWETATGNGDPLGALGATRALKAQLPTWEAQLVKEAVADGATWETIGDSVGVSRQAAWDRFHTRCTTSAARCARTCTMSARSTATR